LLLFILLLLLFLHLIHMHQIESVSCRGRITFDGDLEQRDTRLHLGVVLAHVGDECEGEGGGVAAVRQLSQHGL
jgi:hypothetical protein